MAPPLKRTPGSMVTSNETAEVVGAGWLCGDGWEVFCGSADLVGGMVFSVVGFGDWGGNGIGVGETI